MVHFIFLADGGPPNIAEPGVSTGLDLRVYWQGDRDLRRRCGLKSRQGRKLQFSNSKFRTIEIMYAQTF